jgi:hypothetical protein
MSCLGSPVSRNTISAEKDREGSPGVLGGWRARRCRWPNCWKTVPGMGDSSRPGVYKTSETKVVNFESRWGGKCDGPGNLGGSKYPGGASVRIHGRRRNDRVLKSERWKPYFGVSCVKILDPGAFRQGADPQDRRKIITEAANSYGWPSHSGVVLVLPGPWCNNMRR